MQELGDRLENFDEPVHWSDVWKIYRGPEIASFSNKPVRIDEDHVGGTYSASLTFQPIQEPQGCLKVCKRHKGCIAWTWDSKSGTCKISPWMVVGLKAHGKFSGVHAKRVRKYLARCSKVVNY